MFAIFWIHTIKKVFLRTLTVIEHRTVRERTQEKYIDPLMLLTFWVEVCTYEQKVEAENGREMQHRVGSGKIWEAVEWEMRSQKNCTFMDYAQKLRILRACSLVCINKYLIFLNIARASLII